MTAADLAEALGGRSVDSDLLRRAREAERDAPKGSELQSALRSVRFVLLQIARLERQHGSVVRLLVEGRGSHPEPQS